MLEIARLDTGLADFWSRLATLMAWQDPLDASIEHTVREIISQVRLRGDAALVEYTNRFEHRSVQRVEDLRVPPAQLAAAFTSLSQDQQTALQQAARRISAYHQRQQQTSWFYQEDEVLLGQQVTSLDRVGLYVPGGKAAYPSSVLMNAIPAQVAGVGEIVMVVPAPHGELSALVMAAAHVAGITQVFTMGGAQAIAALAYGTSAFPSVDKIVGPGNLYVATAKRLVYGVVGIDMLAGPSEILVVCDGQTAPRWIALDLFSQAEHDEAARALLLAPSSEYLDRVEDEMRQLLPRMERAEIIRTSLATHGALIRVRDVEEALQIANRLAPEHLELSVEDPLAWLPRVRHAGSVFLGRHTAEALGDYCAGPNHVLPTAGSARFSSPLGVYDFQKRTSFLQCSPKSAQLLGGLASTLARGEGLTAHACSAEQRLYPDPETR